MTRAACRRRSALRRLAVAAGVALAGFAASPGHAFAHAGLESSIPAPSSTLTEAPDSIVLDFDEPVEASIASIQLFDASAEVVVIGQPHAAQGDASVVLADLPDLDDGLYAVVWRAASEDGHVVDGAFSFRIGTGGSGADTSLVDQVRGGAAASPAVDRAADIARLLGFVGLCVVVGAGAFAAMAPPLLADRRATRVLVGTGWGALLVGTLASFALYGAQAVAGGLPDALSPHVWGQVDGTRTGWLLLVRAALVALLGVAALVGVRRPAARTTTPWRASAVALAVGTILTFPSAGHPSTTSPRSLWVLLDGVHLGAVAAWLGGLVLFATGGVAWYAAGGERVVRRFSTAATLLVPVIVLTGALQTIELGNGIDHITDTRWGRTLLVKLAVVTVVLAVAGVSRWLLQNVGVASLRRTVLAEATLGIVVLAVAASLVSQPPRPIDEGRVFSASLAQGGVLADVTITPGRVGSNEVHLLVTPAGGSLTPVTDASARMKLPSRSIPESPVTLAADAPNHFTGSITLPFSGDWTLELVIEVTPGNTVLISTTVPIP
jgi:copper transport protein